jgi:hypothetical protein
VPLAIPAPVAGVVSAPAATAASGKTAGVTPPLLPAAPARKG